ncbi:hypothetical protein, partial [Bacillus thuringiensis]|uniref:hypothetical protein n=1 Tax=Bacillus thuringiensis TaxID=1428 RepID=UPI002175FEFE
SEGLWHSKSAQNVLANLPYFFQLLINLSQKLSTPIATKPFSCSRKMSSQNASSKSPDSP